MQTCAPVEPPGTAEKCLLYSSLASYILCLQRDFSSGLCDCVCLYWCISIYFKNSSNIDNENVSLVYSIEADCWIWIVLCIFLGRYFWCFPFSLQCAIVVVFSFNTLWIDICLEMFINQCRLYGLITPDSLIGNLYLNNFFWWNEFAWSHFSGFFINTVCLAPTDVHKCFSVPTTGAHKCTFIAEFATHWALLSSSLFWRHSAFNVSWFLWSFLWVGDGLLLSYRGRKSRSLLKNLAVLNKQEEAKLYIAVNVTLASHKLSALSKIT